MADKKILGSLEITDKLNPNSSGYGLTLPDTSDFSGDKGISTTKLYKHYYESNEFAISIDFISLRKTQYSSASSIVDAFNSNEILSFKGYNENGMDTSITGIILNSTSQDISFSDGVRTDSISWSDLSNKIVTEL